MLLLGSLRKGPVYLIHFCPVASFSMRMYLFVCAWKVFQMGYLTLLSVSWNQLYMCGCVGRGYVHRLNSFFCFQILGFRCSAKESFLLGVIGLWIRHKFTLISGQCYMFKLIQHKFSVNVYLLHLFQNGLSFDRGIIYGAWNVLMCSFAVIILSLLPVGLLFASGGS